MNAATQTKQRFDDLPFSQQAGIICNDPQFQHFAATRCGVLNQQFTASAAAQYLRDVCKISSRRDLLNDTTAQSQFQTLRTEFDAWTGKIATPR